MSYQAPNKDLLPRFRSSSTANLRTGTAFRCRISIPPPESPRVISASPPGRCRCGRGRRPQGSSRLARSARRQAPRPDVQDGGDIEQHGAALGQLSTIENGSPFMRRVYLAADAAQKFRYFGGWADKIQGQTISTWGGPAHDYVAYEPYGVVGAIIPWNGPLFAGTMVMAPALAAGNCIVVKAPELAPYSRHAAGRAVSGGGFSARGRQHRHGRRRHRRGPGRAPRYR